jgi:hypothetical protein
MNLTYVIILVFGGEHRRLYREVRLDYIVNDLQNPRNHPIYVVEDEIGSSVFHLNDDEPEISVSQHSNQPLTGQKKKVWKMYFDGSSSKEGSWTCILLISPSEKVINLSYKLDFETTNNIAAKDMVIDCIAVFDDYELIINQVSNIY